VEQGAPGLLGSLTIVVIAAALGGYLARLARLPPLLGYLAAGVAVGPNTCGPTANLAEVSTVAELGVAFLMFGLGVQFSFRELAQVRQLATFGVPLQIAATLALGYFTGRWLGLEDEAALFLGAAVAISSTMVPFSLIAQRGELAAVYARVALGITIAQDLGAVLLTMFLPAFSAREFFVLEALAAAAKGAALVLATYVLGTRVVPWLLERAAETQSRELFLITIVALALGIAIGSSALGLSLAFGAFLAGLAVSESEFSEQTLAEVLPLRDIFATIFFVAIGMLLDPAFIAAHLVEIAIVVAVAVLGKFLVLTALVFTLGYSGRVALSAALVLAQMGEFSFVLVTVGVLEGAFNEDAASLALSAVLVSLVLSPFLLAIRDKLLLWLGRIPAADALLERTTMQLTEPEQMALNGHVLVCGYGGTGRELVSALQAYGVPFIVVENDPRVFRELQRMGLPAVYGDARSPTVLERGGMQRASLLAVAIPDLAAAEAAVLTARRLNPTIDIIVRSTGPEGDHALWRAGATEVVYPQFETGLEFIRHTLVRFGVDPSEVARFVAVRRREREGEAIVHEAD
jgi:CPA2 family monovalent cation:H+ antiporter-2